MENNSLIHLFDTRLLSTYTVPGSVLDAGDTAVSKTDEHPRLYRTFALVAQEMLGTFILLLWLSASSLFIEVETEALKGKVTQPVKGRVKIWLHLFIISKSALSTPPGWRERERENTPTWKWLHAPERTVQIGREE